MRHVIEEQQRQALPALDEQRQEELNIFLYDALEYNLLVNIQYYWQGKFIHITGHIDYWDEHNKEIRIVDLDGNVHRIRLGLINDITSN